MLTLLTVTAAAVGGDLLAQAAAGSLVVEWDSQRTLRFWAVRALCAAPIYAAWVNLLERINAVVPEGGGLRTATKVVLDSFAYSPIYQLCFFSALACAEGCSPALALRRTLRMLPRSLMASWSFWVPVQVFTFAVCPPQLRVAWVHGVGLVWNAVLSALNAQL